MSCSAEVYAECVAAVDSDCVVSAWSVAVGSCGGSEVGGWCCVGDLAGVGGYGVL